MSCVVDGCQWKSGLIWGGVVLRKGVVCRCGLRLVSSPVEEGVIGRRAWLFLCSPTRSNDSEWLPLYHLTQSAIFNNISDYGSNGIMKTEHRNDSAEIIMVGSSVILSSRHFYKECKLCVERYFCCQRLTIIATTKAKDKAKQIYIVCRL